MLIMIRTEKSVHQKDSILHADISLLSWLTKVSSLSPSLLINIGLLYILNKVFLLYFNDLLEVINWYRTSMRMLMVINWFELAFSSSILSNDLAVS